jgi:sugar phosphate isomerase/epimerase
MEKSNIVINTLAFLDDLNNGVKQSELLRAIHSLGIKKAEIRREYIKDFTVELQDIRNTSEELQIELYYSVPDYLYINGELAADKIEGYFIEACRMNCKNVKLNIGKYHNVSIENAFIINSLCNKYSIKLTIENDQTEENGRIGKIKEFLRASDLIGMEISCTLDIGNWLWQKEDPEENAKILKPYVTYIHLKDAIVTDHPQAAFLDEGLIPWRSILGIFNKNIPVAIEYPCSPDTLARLQAEIDKLIKVN